MQRKNKKTKKQQHQQRDRERLMSALSERATICSEWTAAEAAKTVKRANIYRAILKHPHTHTQSNNN